MASLTDAGLPITKALRQHLPGSFRHIADILANDIEAGKGRLYELMQEHRKIFSDFECQIVKVGENTGRLENSFKVLADFYQERLELTSNLISGILYPAFVYHFAAVMIPIISLITGECSIMGVIIRIILALGIPYFLVISFFIYLWLVKNYQLQYPLFISKFWISIPLFGILIRKINYARFFHAYSIAIESGLSAVDGVILGAGSCGNAWLKDSFMLTASEIKNNNCPFSEALKRNIFPADRGSVAIQLMESGEVSGRSDDSAAKLAELYRTESQSAMKIIVAIVPKVIYFCVAIYIGWKIINFWSNIFAKTTRI